ncbi:MAG: hypothetical protein ACK5MV_05235 [Aminipila sp.]
MEAMLNALIRGLTAAANFFVAACSLAISNPWFLALTVLMLISGGKSLKLGKIFAVKG